MIQRTQIETIAFEQEKVLEIIRNNQFAKGEYLDELPIALATTFRKQNCLLCSNGSSALLLSVISIKPGSEVLVPAASTCYSIPNAVLAAGATPVFCDLDPATGNLCATEASRIFESKPFDIVISPNHFGIPSDVGAFQNLGVHVIEDCAQSVMTNAVSGIRGDVAILSFYPTKYLNGMDGGAILTNDERIFRAAADAVYYDEQISFDGRVRFNLRSSNLNAYLAWCSLRSAIAKIQIYKDLFSKFAERCSDLGIEYLRSDVDFVGYKFIIKLATRVERDGLIQLLRQNMIEAAQEMMMISESSSEPNALELTETTMSLPFHQGINDSDIDKIFSVLKDGI
jgi:perosamine synthetase